MAHTLEPPTKPEPKAPTEPPFTRRRTQEYLNEHHPILSIQPQPPELPQALVKQPQPPELPQALAKQPQPPELLQAPIDPDMEE